MSQTNMKKQSDTVQSGWRLRQTKRPLRHNAKGKGSLKHQLRGKERLLSKALAVDQSCDDTFENRAERKKLRIGLENEITMLKVGIADKSKIEHEKKNALR